MSNQITQFCKVVIFDSVDKIVYADILYFVEHVFSWNVACERGKPPEGAIARVFNDFLYINKTHWILLYSVSTLSPENFEP